MKEDPKSGGVAFYEPYILVDNKQKLTFCTHRLGLCAALLSVSLTFRKIFFNSWGSALFVARAYNTDGMREKQHSGYPDAVGIRLLLCHSCQPAKLTFRQTVQF